MAQDAISVHLWRKAGSPAVRGGRRCEVMILDHRDEASMKKKNWIVVSTHPHREGFALQNLQRQDFESYCPLIIKRLRTRKGAIDVRRPLFPGYLFVHVEPEMARWRPLASTYGIRSIVRCGERLSFIDDSFVAGMKAREVDGVIGRPQSPFQIGQEVRIAGGPFDGLIARILEMDDKDRLVVLMALLNGEVKLKLHGSGVTAL